MNNTQIPVPAEIYYKFNGIKFHDDIHKYFVGEKNLISVTTILHAYEQPFDDAYWAEIKGGEYGMSQLEVLEMWGAWNLKSQIRGSAVHNYAELLFNNKIYKITQDEVDQKLGPRNIEILKTYPTKYQHLLESGIMSKMEGYTIMEEYETLKGYVQNFYRDTFNKLIPIRTEFVMYDELWGLSGMLDILFWNVKKKCFQIWDYKTNKELRKNSDFGTKMKYPLNKLDNCEYSTYSLQLSAYKSILERNIPIEIKGMYLIWLHEGNPNYEIIECQDLSAEILKIMQ